MNIILMISDNLVKSKGVKRSFRYQAFDIIECIINTCFKILLFRETLTIFIVSFIYYIVCMSSIPNSNSSNPLSTSLTGTY